MKKLCYFLLLISGICNAQIVNIPDLNFKAKLLSASAVNNIAYGNGGYFKIDTNNDGEIQEIEAQSVDSLNVSFSNITNLLGVSSFTNLKNLNCSINQITTLDSNSISGLEVLNCYTNALSLLNVTSLTNLKILKCGDNPFTSLDLSGLINLNHLECTGGSTLASLDVNGLTNLKYLSCSGSFTNINISGLTNLLHFDVEGSQSLTSVNLSGLTNLSDIFINSNFQLSTLILNGLPNLVTLRCQDSYITTLDVSSAPNIVTLNVESNRLTSLDVSALTNLTYLYCGSNQLTSLFLKNGTNEAVSIWNNVNLQFICADESQIANLQNQMNQVNPNNNTVINSYCSFTPGGNYNTITGIIKYDANNNGCDANDLVQPNVRVNINDPAQMSGASFTNNSGNYSFYTQAGTFTVTPDVENPTWFNFSPNTADVVFADNNNNTATQDFCITPNGLHLDIETVISPLTNARPGFDAVYKLVIKNKGNQTQSGLLSFNYNYATLDYVSSSQLPETQADGSVGWYYGDLLPFESRSILVTLNVNSPTETPAVNIGDILNYSLFSYPSEIDETPADNQFTYNQTVVGSLDPNDITCLEGELLPPSAIGNYLHYAINFENTGNYPAENIVVKTEVDATKFDINSLQLLNTSHPVDARITGNKVEFIFKNIALDTNGHGHILLKIKSKDTVLVGETVTKRADIFFDYNFPVDTGMASTTFQTLSNAGFELDDSIGIYPNPTSSKITINSDFNIKSIQVYDIQGKILETIIGNNKILDITDKSSGVYFLKITTEKGSKIEKVVKE